MAFQAFNFGKQLGIVGGEAAAAVQTTVVQSDIGGFQTLTSGKQLGIVGGGSQASLRTGSVSPEIVRSDVSPSATGNSGSFPFVAGKTSIEWPSDPCFDGNLVITDIIEVESSPLDPGYRRLIVDCIPRSSGGGQGPVTYYNPPPSEKRRYPIPIEDFKKETGDALSRDELAKIFVDCDELVKEFILDAYDLLFDKDKTIMNKYPPFVYDCLLNVFNRIKKIKCHQQTKKGYDVYLDGDTLHVGDVTALENMYTVLWTFLTNNLGQSGSRCAGLSGLVAVLMFEKSKGDESESQWIEKWCEENRHRFDSKRNPFWHTEPLEIVIVDTRDGRVYSNPFYPDRPPQSWKPTKENFLYVDYRLRCII